MEQGLILKRPIITEKSLALSSQGKYTFEVDPKARKGEIARAIEETFGVHVVSLRTIKIKGKKHRFGRRRKEVVSPSIKKAIAQLLPEEKIDIFAAGGEKAKGGS